MNQQINPTTVNTSTSSLVPKQPASIDTLVQDIYALFSSDTTWIPDPGRVSAFGQRLAKHVADRASATRSKPSLRLSNLGTPSRKLWYTINEPDSAEELRPEVYIKFLYGDILEELLLFLAEEAGHDVRGQQDEVEVGGVKGHRDAVIDGRVVDVKSASSYSFRKFESHNLVGDDPFGYLAQLGSYVSASARDEAVTDTDVGSFLVIDKTLGHLTLDTYPVTDTDYEKLVEEKRKVLAQESPPDEFCYQPVPDGKSGNEKLDVGCSYCPFKWRCHPNLRAFIYSTGPTYLTKVERTPKVVEVNQHGEVIYRDY